MELNLLTAIIIYWNSTLPGFAVAQQKVIELDSPA